MPAILAIDTSTEACSCALSIDGKVTERLEYIPRQHTRRLLPMISELMADNRLTYADLDAVAFGCGPGSFTGLRIAAGVVQGIAFGAGIPVIPVSTLAAMAWDARQQTGNELIFSCLDARINEVYWGLYRVGNDAALLVGEEHVEKPESVTLLLDEPCYGAGNGMAFIGDMSDRLRASIHDYSSQILPRSECIARLAEIEFGHGNVVTPEMVSPTYLRDRVTQG